VIDAGKFGAQEIVDAPVAKTTARMGNLDDLAG
jgi:hypothetical protein